MLQAAVFDMDGLLVDSEPLWQAAEMQVFAEVGVRLTRRDCWATKGWRVDATVAHWFALRPWSNPAPREVESRLVARVLELIREQGEPKPGARHALGFFRSAGLRLALASSSEPRLIQAVLERLGMRADFEVVRSAADEAHGKPHPAVYLAAARGLGVEPSRCVALEDSPVGVAAARAAGMKCIAVPDRSSGPEGDALLSSVAQADVTLTSLAELNESLWPRLQAAPSARHADETR